jgi:D-threonate/D-erythronate kinase
LNESKTPLVGIFADDLTGALDAAAPFAARGFTTIVSPTAELPQGAEDTQVISINLGTRHASPDFAVKQAEVAVAAFRELGVGILLNKVDSTLRGNPGVELTGALGVLGADHAILCPSYPQNGRTVENGVLMVGGVEIAKTDVGQDKLSPLASSNIEEIVIASLERAGISDQVHVRGHSGGKSVADLLPVIVTADARTESDLLLLAERLLAAESVVLVAGSAGASVALADVLSEVRPNLRPQMGPTSRSQRILIVTASQRTIIDEQLKLLGNHVDLIQAELSVEEALDGVSDDSIGQITRLTGLDGLVVLKLGKLDNSVAITTEELRTKADDIVRNLGAAVRAITDLTKPDVLIVIGGDTTSGVLNACGVSSIKLHGELQPGTVNGTALNGSIANTLLVTRAGGFGDESSLVELVSLLAFGQNV